MTEITIETKGRVGKITIKNPEKRNALSEDLLDELCNAVESLRDRDKIYVIVLTGVGERAFSSGLDISEFSEDDPLAGEYKLQRLLRLVENLKYPTIAKVNGDAVGAGFELVAACDLRIAAEDSRLGLTPAKIGIIPSDRAIRQVMTAVGPTNAKELLFTAKLINADRAHEMGLLNSVTDRSELDERVDTMAEDIASNAPLSLKGINTIIDALLDKKRLTQAEKDWAERLQKETFTSADHKEGRSAFKENRAPEFEGR